MPACTRGAGESQAVALCAAALPASVWARQTMQAGSPGPLVAACVTRWVIALREALPGPQGWGSRRRSVLTGALPTSRRTAPAARPQSTLVRLRGMRWPLATCGEDGTQSLGRGAYDVRSGRGWPHPMTVGIVDHVCLVRPQGRGKKTPRR